ncbi:hypothetical protein PIB30_102227 [Stylosanthes scabra]|uniref:Uncharacterized protein n=1 Tax=Stylosanthes scabra TaxID=79078 RepID=A0ABU6RYE8_9FABA|nr:hypothetical protein [Stylosanthes scabra]
MVLSMGAWALVWAPRRPVLLLQHFQGIEHDLVKEIIKDANASPSWRNKPPLGGGINPCPHPLGIHNCEDTDLTMDSSKSRVTGINSPAVQAWQESTDNTRGCKNSGESCYH